MKKINAFIFLLLVSVFYNGCSNKRYVYAEGNNANKFTQESSRAIIKEDSNTKIKNRKTIMAICKHESNYNPYAINVNKSKFNFQRGSHFFKSKYAANLYMDFTLDPLGLNYDIGYCQINSQHLKRLKISNEDLLDKEMNMKIASDIYSWNLKHCKGEEVCALSMYNTGYKNSTIGKKYAYKVLKIRKKLYNF